MRFWPTKDERRQGDRRKGDRRGDADPKQELDMHETQRLELRKAINAQSDGLKALVDGLNQKSVHES